MRAVSVVPLHFLRVVGQITIVLQEPTGLKETDN